MGLTDAIVKFLSKIFFGNEWLSVTVAAMLPMIEVRGAIPIALGFNMSYGQAFLWSAFSAIIVAPILFFLFIPILNWLKKYNWFKKFALSVEKMFSEKALKIEAKAKERADLSLSSEQLEKNTKTKLEVFKAIGVLIFVGIPLPFTGVWTGSIIAAFLNIKWYFALPALILGNFLASAIVLLLCVLLGTELMDIILYVLFGFILITIAGLIFKFVRKNGKKEEKVNKVK